VYKGMIYRDKKDILYDYLTILGEAYKTGDYEELFPLLANDCVWESQWRLTPESGKEAVEAYFRKKGSILKETGSFPKYIIVEFIDNINPIKNAGGMLNGQEFSGNIGLLYESGKLAIFAAQQLDDVENGMIIDLSLNEENKISRIDLCMPELFKFKKYERAVKY